jgi:parallel beta-helix repeat protein
MWFDIDDFAGEIRQCRCQHNTRYGIFIEISGDFLVTDNLCTDNGEVGICVAESRDCYVAFNTCVNNQYGIIARGYDLPRRHGGTRYAYRDENITIRNNLLAYNSAAGFDLHWDWSKVGPDRPESRTLDADKVGLV